MGTFGLVLATTTIEVEGELDDGDALVMFILGMVGLVLAGVLIWLIRTGRIRIPGDGD